MASCDQDIFEVLDSVDDKDLPTQFMSNAAPILEHAKDEVTDYLQTKSTDVLKKVRELVFSELVAKLPDLAGRELYARKNRDLLTNDIYVFIFSWINGLPDKRITKCLKPVVSRDETHISVSEEDVQTQSLVELCMKLQETVGNLQTEVSTLKMRVTQIEQNDTRRNISNRTEDQSQRQKHNQKAVSLNQTNIISIAAEEDRPSSVDTDCDRGCRPKESASKLSDQTKHIKDHVENPIVIEQIKPQAQINGETWADLVSKTPSDSGLVGNGRDKKDNGSAVTKGTSRPNSDGFQHTVEERRSILKGRTNLRATTLGQQDIKGTSEKVHIISAAEERRTHLLYVGGLHVNTAEKDLRSHLCDIQIRDVADVVMPSKRPARQASFCVSLETDRSMTKAFSPENWPTGVTVRPFRPARNGSRQHIRDRPQREWRTGSINSSNSDHYEGYKERQSNRRNYREYDDHVPRTWGGYYDPERRGSRNVSYDGYYRDW